MTRFAIAAVSLALVVLGASSAQGELAQEGRLRVSVSATLSPKSLPRTGFAPVAVSLGGEISTADGSQGPQLRQLRIELNRGGRIENRGLPLCPQERIRIATSQRALAACRGALVGEGSFRADVVLAGQEPYPSLGRLLIFNARQEGKPVLLGHVYAEQPFATSFLIVFEISKRAKGTFGTVLSASLPEALGDWGYVTEIEMRLHRTYRFGGERRSYLSAGCPAPKGFPNALFTLARASFFFADGARVRATLNRSCGVR